MQQIKMMTMIRMITPKMIPRNHRLASAGGSCGTNEEKNPPQNMYIEYNKPNRMLRNIFNI